MLQPFSSPIFPVLTTFNKSDRHFTTLHLIRPRLFTFSCYHCFQSSCLNISIPVLPMILHTPCSIGLFNMPYNPPISSQPTIQLDSSLKDYGMVLFPKVQLLVRFSLIT